MLCRTTESEAFHAGMPPAHAQMSVGHSQLQTFRQEWDRPVPSGKVSLRQGLILARLIVSQRVKVSFAARGLLGEPDLVSPHERAVQEHWVVRRENNLSAFEIIL